MPALTDAAFPMLKLNYRGQTTIPVEIEGFTPEVVQGLSLAEIARWEIFHGNQQVPLAEFFAVSGDPGDLRFEFAGDLSVVHWIGAHMTQGEIHVQGNAGRHLGSEMRGGAIHVAGNAGDWVGGEMHGGLIHVQGSAGHLVGAAYRGSRRGMTGGTILIGGNVGNEIGHTMRRGWIAVGGSAGDMVGFNMIAGSLFFFGGLGIRPGAGMRRGTIVILGSEVPRLLPSFKHDCRCRQPAIALMLHELRRSQFPFDDALLDADYDLHTGDFVALGKGEILIKA